MKNLRFFKPVVCASANLLGTNFLHRKGMVIFMDIGSRLKEARRGKATQQQIAELLNTTQQQISKYENNTQEIPCRHIVTLARYFGVSADYLLCLTDSPQKHW